MMQSQRAYLPAAGVDLLLPLYDPITRIIGVDKARQALIEQAGLETGHRVLDVGCGTGTLAISVKRRYPRVDVVGIDPDPRALRIARDKADRAGALVRFHMGFADRLGYRDASFDRVFSSLMFHHLEPEQKAKALAEVQRVLRPGGRLEFLDLAGPDSRGHGALSRLMHSHQRLKDNAEGRILELMAGAGFERPTLLREQATLFGRLAFYQATAPASGWT